MYGYIHIHIPTYTRWNKSKFTVIYVENKYDY